MTKLSEDAIFLIRCNAKRAFSNGRALEQNPWPPFQASCRRQRAVWTMAWVEARKDKELLDLVRWRSR